jgi:hypothetical protein
LEDYSILAVFFLVNGTPTTHPDFPPLVQPNMVICQERRANAQEYFDSLDGGLPEADRWLLQKNGGL